MFLLHIFVFHVICSNLFSFCFFFTEQWIVYSKYWHQKQKLVVRTWHWLPCNKWYMGKKLPWRDEQAYSTWRICRRMSYRVLLCRIYTCCCTVFVFSKLNFLLLNLILQPLLPGLLSSGVVVSVKVSSMGLMYLFISCLCWIGITNIMCKKKNTMQKM